LNSTKIKSITEYIEFVEDLKFIKVPWFRGVANIEYTPKPGIVWRDISPPLESSLEHQFLVSYKSYCDESLGAWDLMALM
jgi:hypothetical protein